MHFVQESISVISPFVFCHSSAKSENGAIDGSQTPQGSPLYDVRVRTKNGGSDFVKQYRLVDRNEDQGGVGLNS